MARVKDLSGNHPLGADYVDEPEDNLYEETLAATGNTTGFMVSGTFNVTLSGTWVGTALIQRSFDNGSNYSTVSKDSAGADASFTAVMSMTLVEPENGVLYRINWTRTSGSLTVRFSR